MKASKASMSLIVSLSITRTLTRVTNQTSVVAGGRGATGSPPSGSIFFKIRRWRGRDFGAPFPFLPYNIEVFTLNKGKIFQRFLALFARVDLTQTFYNKGGTKLQSRTQNYLQYFLILLMVVLLCEYHHNHNKANKGTRFEFDQIANFTILPP